MNRKDFLKKGLIGTTLLSASSTVFGRLMSTSKQKSKESEVLGFNHIPKTNSKLMANTVLHKADTRGRANHGWLDARHSFSFANYHNPERMNFGVLRVLNDDKIAAAKGFATHPHDNMEIITIPLEGDLEHKDNMGNGTVIKQGDIQVMSAGTGITHSEFNANKDRDVKLLQIWLFPKKSNVKPRYDQISLKSLEKKNEFYQVLSPYEKDQGVWIHQNAWFHLGDFDKKIKKTYDLKDQMNGLYVFLISGNVSIEGQNLESRDGFGIWDTDKIEMDIEPNSKLLLMEVPMNI